MAALIAPEVASPPGELAGVHERLRARDADGAREAMSGRCERVRRDVLRVLTKSTSVSRAGIEMPSQTWAHRSGRRDRARGTLFTVSRGRWRRL
ncbi:hypothetical protein ACFYUV_31735 [Nonomuraea sp. NPDC003560]|uniref:hypothetical protein n=1 Tax=Nonomuraea sp. NPDC003560 TaxID=3364341 RepID=UPI0036B4740B